MRSIILCSFSKKKKEKGDNKKKEEERKRDGKEGNKNAPRVVESSRTLTIRE